MLFRLAISGVLCFSGALSHEIEEDYKLGDSDGCEAGWVSVKNIWQCYAAMDRVDRLTEGDQNLGTFSDAAMGTEGPGRATGGGCGYLRANAKTGTPNLELSYWNPHMNGKYDPSYWSIPPLPYCMRADSKIHKNEVLFLGGSKVDLWQTTSEEFPGSYNIGRMRETGRETRERLNHMLEFFEPSVVVLDCGEQDLDNGLSVRKTYRHVKRITQIILDHHAALVYLGTRPEPQKTHDYHAKYRKLDLSVKRLVRRLAEDDHYMHDHKSIAMIDVHKNFMDAGNPRDLYTFDGLQLSPTGYKLWTSWTQKALDDSMCLVWGDGKCKRRRTMSPLRRATMVIGSSEGAMNATSISSKEIIV
jgi:hypothetical protein